MSDLSDFDVLPDSYEEANQEYLYFYSRITIVVTIVLIMAGTVLDHLFFPEQYWNFLALRVIASCVIGGVLWLIVTKLKKSQIKSITLAWAMVPQLMINYMIAKTGGPESIYFVGLTYALTGLGVFFPLTLVEASGFSGATIVLYVIACLAGANGEMDTNIFYGNLTFLSFFVIVMVVVSVYGERWRLQTFRLQQETKARGKAIKESNKALTEAKLQLVQSEKMASLGTLSAGLLHELNNPINYSAMAVRLTSDYLRTGDIASASDVTQDAITGINRVIAIISDLKTFAYQRGSTESPLDGRFNLLEAVRVAGRLTAHERIGFQFDIEIPEDMWVCGDAGLISSVFINLLSNSARALVQAKRGKDGRIVIKALPGQAIGRVAVSVYDNGTGISSSNIRRVFEPFFTTRKVGEGLGMGLSISYAIVQRHGSLLSVSSLEGEYTEFNFELQVNDEPME